ncbi:MAG: hypothetical protein NTV02_01510 [Candidatus Zambryskibacteria bacterium]|nr:hypothetical protein [Candidatus Zambryskibacteria bacterium]
MNEVIQEIASYLDKLPPRVREIISRASWESKVGDIGKKYSLSEDQVKDIGFEVLFVLVGMEPQEDLSINIETELGVSKILSDQIAEEIENRIIAPITKQIEQSKNNVSISASTKNTSEFFKLETENTLDIPPPNLPGEEIESFSNTQSPQEMERAQTHWLLEDQVTESKPAEPIEKPVQSTEQYSFKTPAAPSIPIPTKPTSFIQNKLTEPTKPSFSTDAPPTRTYSTDPYREPID